MAPTFIGGVQPVVLGKTSSCRFLCR